MKGIVNASMKVPFINFIKIYEIFSSNYFVV